jgi:hypothetical protein
MAAGLTGDAAPLRQQSCLKFVDAIKFLSKVMLAKFLTCVVIICILFLTTVKEKKNY